MPSGAILAISGLGNRLLEGDAAESSRDAMYFSELGAKFYPSGFLNCKSIDEDFPLPVCFFHRILPIPPGTMDWGQANPARAGRQQRQFDPLCRSSLADFFYGGKKSLNGG